MMQRIAGLLTLLMIPLTSAWISTSSTPHVLRPYSFKLCGSPDDYYEDVEEDETPTYAKPRHFDESLLGDLTGGRPGAIIETEDQLAEKQRMTDEIADGTRKYPDWMKDYGRLIEDQQVPYNIDDPNALDASTLGTWTIQDLRSKFDWEWDPFSGEPDPNKLALKQEGTRYVPENAKDDDGVEIGYDPMFGPSNPIDTRTILGAKDSYMIDDNTRDDSMLTPQFKEGDPEIDFNHDVVQFRKSLDIMETYVDRFLPEDLPIPRHVAKWYGYPEQVYLEPKNFTNNRFTEHPTDFNDMTPHRARQRAVELARSQNAEWLPEGVSQAYHQSQRQVYEEYGTLVGTTRKGEIDQDLLEQIQPALKILGSCVELLETIDGTIYRFYYHGLMKNKHGMRAWTETLLTDCGVQVTGVIFETGFRRRDAAYDGGDPYYGPRS